MAMEQLDGLRMNRKPLCLRAIGYERLIGFAWRISFLSVPVNGVSELPKTAKEDEPSACNDDTSPSGSQASSSFSRKVARSRSVGCRSFSGDFLERISNGFGDCTLRRVESHREAKQKSSIQRLESEDEEQR